ncbi:NAD-dependent epimerase/dehydratase family protein [Ornithinimicrobium avium]|uniref:NAD-dependent epimerase/dehydratase family protein n=1 Tax=Ornithinimicrobium avium TaxID=2283195 RepID=A0A345NPB6_9MICO|nr:NAD-dependent epimerase/dehydratase family protein [Ornithinimicrobium avium]AXH96874.1 NAD-dependent epimerase/dehydratase family protein [Ornithinimicrobium avium]
MNILITGGAGFIGSNLARQALEAGHDVSVLDDFSTGLHSNLENLDLRLIEGSLLEPTLLERAMSGTDAVVHLAALGSVPRSVQRPLPTHHANATGTLAVLDRAVQGGQHVIVASSSSVYGANRKQPKQEHDWVAPMSPYAVSKLASEHYALAFQECYGLPVLPFRFFNVYGGAQRADHAYAAVVPLFIDRLLRGLPLPINGDGSQSRDFTYVGSVCRIVLDAIERRVTSTSPVNLAFGGSTTILELAQLLGELAQVEPVLEHRQPRAGDVPASQADDALLRALFPEQEPVELRAGLEATLQWFNAELEAERRVPGQRS